MKAKIRKIGNSFGIIIPRRFLDEVKNPAEFDMSIISDEIVLKPLVCKENVRRKPRDETEITVLEKLAEANLEKAYREGRIVWVSDRVIERKIDTTVIK